MGSSVFLLLVPSSIVAIHAIQRLVWEHISEHRAEELLLAGKKDEGIQSLQLYVRSNPSDTKAAIRLAMLWVDSNEPEALYESQQILLRAARSGEATTPIRSSILKLHLLFGERAEAFRAARELEKSD